MGSIGVDHAGDYWTALQLRYRRLKLRDRRQELMHKERFERYSPVFPARCVRCGVENPTRQFQLVLPYRAWWRANPVIKSPTCTKCFLVLRSEDWLTLILMLAASLATTRYLSPCLVVLIIRADRRLFKTVPHWLVSQGFSTALVCTVLISASWLFGSYRDRVLRRQRLKITLTDYSTDWVEIESNDDSYFSDLAAHWRAFS